MKIMKNMKKALLGLFFGLFVAFTFSSCEKEEETFDLYHLHGYWAKVDQNYVVDTAFIQNTGIIKIHIYPGDKTGYVGATFTTTTGVLIPKQVKSTQHEINFDQDENFNIKISLQYPFENLKCKLLYDDQIYILTKVSKEF